MSCSSATHPLLSSVEADNDDDARQMAATKRQRLRMVMSVCVCGSGVHLGRGTWCVELPGGTRCHAIMEDGPPQLGRSLIEIEQQIGNSFTGLNPTPIRCTFMWLDGKHTGSLLLCAWFALALIPFRLSLLLDY